MPTTTKGYSCLASVTTRKAGKAMISMSKIYSIRQMRMEGRPIAHIAKTLEISRDTVYKYLEEEDLSPRPPVKRERGSVLDQYRPTIASWLEDDAKGWRKQRHTAKRIWQRLTDELGAEVSESTVRHYVGKLKKELGIGGERFLDLVWAPGEAQADFGEADFYVAGVRRRLSYFVLTFPFSNVGLAQVFPGENAECVCQALKDIFEYLGGVPARIVFDNAAGVGRKTGDAVRTAGLFSAFAAHYGFAFSFCNPNSGHEKGSVENKVGYIRRNLFVPVPSFDGGRRFNKTLLARCMALAEKPHWAKGEEERALFMEDRVALLGLPPAPFDVVRYERRRTDKLGRVRLESRHLYSTSPEFALTEVICAIRAREVVVADAGGTVIATHTRAYGDAPSDTSNPASQLALLARKPGAWRNSRVRAAVADELREYMDGLGRDALAERLRLMRNVAAQSGWEAMVEAAATALESTGRIDEAGMHMAVLSRTSTPIRYDEPVDLSVYDALARKGV